MILTKYLVRLLPVVAIVGGTIVSCQKETPQPNQINTDQVEPARGPSLPPQNQAYLAECQLNGTCSGVPVFTTNSTIRRFDAPTVLNEIQFSNDCNVVATAYDPISGLLYTATRNTTNSISELYAYNSATGINTLVSALTYSSAIFYVNEMEFDNAGNLYFLRTGNDRQLFKYNFTGNTISVISGAMFPTHVGTYREALAFNIATGELRLVYEIPAVSGAVTRVATINTTNSALSNISSMSIPNVNQFNISAYYDSGALFIARDNGSGTGNVYNSAGTLINSVSCRNTHDATWQSAVADPL